MSIWSTFANTIKGIVSKMIGRKTIEQELHVVPAISNEMIQAIELWTMMYEDKSPWLKGASFNDPSEVKSLGLPQLIASEKARMALLEFESEITTPMKDVKPTTPNYMNGNNIGTDGKPEPMVATHVVAEPIPKGPTDRADYLNKQYIKLKDALRTQIEYGIAKGGLVIKPYLIKHEHPAITQEADMLTGKITNENAESNLWEIGFDYVQANDFYPLAFDASGKITEAAFIQRKIDKDTTYSRLEYHKYTDNKVQVINKAFKAKTINAERDMLGEEIPLSQVPEWAMISPDTTINDVDRLLFAYFKMPEANNIDTYSPLGVSGFDKAKSLIEEADKQYSRMLWEFEGGELAIDVDRYALNTTVGADGQEHTVPNKLQARLFRKVDLNEDNTYEVFSPTLREGSLINGLNTILMRIEDITGLSRGTLSDVLSEAKTATELKILRQRSYQTNAHIQKSIETALKDVIYIMNVYCDLYDITPSGEYEVSFEWDDSIIADSDIELSRRIMLIQNGLASKLETRMWYFGETERQAKEALMLIQQENVEAVQQNIAEMDMLGETPASKKEESPKDENKDNNFKSGDNQYSE